MSLPLDMRMCWCIFDFSNTFFDGWGRIGDSTFLIIVTLRGYFCILLGRLTFPNFKAILSLIKALLDDTS